MTKNSELTAALRRLAGAERLPGKMEGDADLYRRLERIMELAGAPWTPGLLGREARLANFIEDEGPYDCRTGSEGTNMRISAVLDTVGGARIVSDADIREHGLDAALLAAPDPHSAAFRRALDRTAEANEPDPARGHDWRWHPAADRSDAPNPLACAHCGLIARRPESAPADCRPGLRAPVHYSAPWWFFRNPGAVVHAAAGPASALSRGEPSLCGRVAEHFAGLTPRGTVLSPWNRNEYDHSGTGQAYNDCERADCGDCIGAMASLPHALTDPHDWRIGGDAHACPACGITQGGGQSFGCDSGRYMEWQRRSRKSGKADQVIHHRDWACPAARRREAGLPTAAGGRRITCFSCLRSGQKQPSLASAPALL